MSKAKRFESSFSYKLIYIFRINDKAHEGLLKIGDATLKTDESVDSLPPNCKKLNQAAKERINSYTNTAGITYDLLHTELAIRTDINAGKTPKEWNEKILHDSHFKVVSYWSDCSMVFPSVDIKGGIAVTMWDKSSIFEPIEVFSPFEELNHIRTKSSPEFETDSLTDIIYNQLKFNLDAMYNDYPELKNNIGKGVRVVRVPADVIELLKLYKAEQERYILDMGDKWIGTDFLFTQYDGSLMSIQTPYEWLREYCAKYGLTFKAIHSMRHYVASAMILSHMEDIKVSRVLGHAQVSTTKEIYAHLFDDASDEARKAIERRLFKSGNKE